MAIDGNICKTYEEKYSPILDQYMREVGEDLSKYTSIEYGCRGIAHLVDQIGLMKWKPKDTRMGKTQLDEAPFEKRYMVPEPLKSEYGFDEDDHIYSDRLDQSVSKVIAGMRSAAVEESNRVLIDNLVGVNKIGVNAQLDELLDPSLVVPVNYVNPADTAKDTGMSVAKMLRALQLFRSARVWSDARRAAGDEIVMVMNAQMLNDLLLEAQKDGKVTDVVRGLVEGTVDKYAGFRIRNSEYLPLDASGRPQAVAWVKSRVMFGFWENVRVKVSERSDLEDAIQIRGKVKMGATRLQQNAVIPVLCAN